MLWFAKAILQNLISLCPSPERVNYFFQRYVTRNLPQTDKRLLERANYSYLCFKNFIHYGKVSPDTAYFLEFGAGWDILNSLLFYLFGAKQQTIVDLRPNARLPLICHTITQLTHLKELLSQNFNLPFRTFPIINEMGDIKKLGITYKAPLDMRNTRFEDESFDYITNIFTLEHIPQNDIIKILSECVRVLRKEGIMISCVDMNDHYAYFDHRISYYNFLKYDDTMWRFFNSALHYQNRLRYPDYKELLQQSGLKIISEHIVYPSQKDFNILRQIKLSPYFETKYSLEDLGIHTAIFITSKR